MNAPPSSPPALRSLSIDYSEDELDALADLFGVPALGSARLRRPPASGTEEAVLRATLATATRSLVARRAMVLSGTAIAPTVELLEPHATLLRTFLGSTTVVSVERAERSATDRWVVFVREGVAVEQRAVQGRAIVRMTAHPAAALHALVAGPLSFEDSGAQPEGTPVAAAVRTLEEPPGADLSPGTPERLREVLYARRQTIDVKVVRRLEGAVERTRLRWIDSGRVGLFRVEPDADEATATLTPTTADAVERELAAACAVTGAAA